MAKVYTKQQRASKLMQESMEARMDAEDGAVDVVDFKGFRAVPLSDLENLEFFLSAIISCGSYTKMCIDIPYGYTERILARTGLLESPPRVSMGAGGLWY